LKDIIARKNVENNKTKHILDMLFFLRKQVNVCVFVCLYIDVHTYICMCVCIYVSKSLAYGQPGQNVRTGD